MSSPDKFSEDYWNEDDLVPATEEEMRDGLRAAMEKYADLLPSPADDLCQCLVCRSFRRWIHG